MEIPSTLAILLTPLLTCLFIHIIHRHLHRHDRKLPPGPWPLPIIGNLHQVGNLPHRSFCNLSKTYGPIMLLRLGTKPTVVISSPEAAELVLKSQDHVFSGRPQVRVAEQISYGNKGMSFVDSGAYWKSLRKLSKMQLVNPSRLEFFAPMRRDGMRTLVERLKAAHGVVDVSEEVGRLNGDMSCKMILGCGTEDRYNLKPVTHEALRLLGAFNLADYLPLLEAFDLQGITRRAKAVHRAADEVLEEILKEHEQDTSGKYKGDFVDTLLSIMGQPVDNPLNNKPVAHRMERDNVKALILEMIEGSYDTASIAIEWALSELIRNPHSMRLLQEELEAVVGMDQAVEESDLPKLRYLNMVVKESFRLHSPVPMILKKCMEDAKVGGFTIPKDTRVIINSWAIGRDTHSWSENAEEFLPERFADSGLDVKGRDFQLLPFGSGRRICPGMNLGLINTRLVLAQLVHCFNWELPKGISPRDLDMTEEFGLTMARAKHLLLVPKYRLHV